MDGLVCVCVCALPRGIISANSIYITGRVLSEKMTVNRLVKFIQNLICVFENEC